jgi:hypothetical protein
MTSEAEGEQVGAKRRKYPRSLHVHSIKVSEEREGRGRGGGRERRERAEERGKRGKRSEECLYNDAL